MIWKLYIMQMICKGYVGGCIMFHLKKGMVDWDYLSLMGCQKATGNSLESHQRISFGRELAVCRLTN